MAAARGKMFRIIDTLVDRAREHGAVRDDVTGTDVVLLMCAPNYVTSSLPGAGPCRSSAGLAGRAPGQTPGRGTRIGRRSARERVAASAMARAARASCPVQGLGRSPATTSVNAVSSAR